MHEEDFHDVVRTLPSSGVSPPARRVVKPPEIKRYDHLFKLIIIGDPSVGKTNLTMKFCDYDFSPHYVATIGIDFKVKTVEIAGKRIKLQIWDTAGQERFQSISKMYYRGAHGVIFVYDVTHHRSFENVRRWLATYKDASGDFNVSSDIPKFLIGNKCDDHQNRVVSSEAGLAAAKTNGLGYFETSAKTGENVEAVFLQMAEEILFHLEKEQQRLQLPKTVLSKRKKKSRTDSRKTGWLWSGCNLL